MMGLFFLTHHQLVHSVVSYSRDSRSNPDKSIKNDRDDTITKIILGIKANHKVK